jgi:hypothetical protein
LELTLIFGLRVIALPSALLPLFFEAARARPPAAPASAAPPATSGTFALPTACFTASTFECLLDEPFEWDAPLLEMGALSATDFAADLAVDLTFAAFDFAFGFDLDLADADFERFADVAFARFGAARFFAALGLV